MKGSADSALINFNLLNKVKTGCYNRPSGETLPIESTGDQEACCLTERAVDPAASVIQAIVKRTPTSATFHKAVQQLVFDILSCCFRSEQHSGRA